MTMKQLRKNVFGKRCSYPQLRTTDSTQPQLVSDLKAVKLSLHDAVLVAEFTSHNYAVRTALLHQPLLPIQQYLQHWLRCHCHTR